MLKKVKDWLGIEGVKVELLVEEKFRLKDEVLNGSIIITSQSQQHVNQATITLKEKYKRGRRSSKLIDEYVLGTVQIDVSQDIDRDQTITMEFRLPFRPIKSPIDRWGDKNFLYRGISKVAKMAKNAHSNYEVLVELSVSGNKLRPYSKREIVAE